MIRKFYKQKNGTYGESLMSSVMINNYSFIINYRKHEIHKMKQNIKILMIAGAISLSLTACTGTNLTKAQRGAIIGGVAGAVIGKSTSNHKTKRAVLGGAVGAAAGAAIGAYMDKQEETLRDTMQGTGIEIDRQGDNIVLNMPDSITFDTAKADLKPQFHPVLSSLATTLSQYDQTKIKIAGHTDNRGSDHYNQTLSQQRATSVKNFLSGRGVNYSRMYSHGYGESRPVADNSTQNGMAQNRRVEITLVPVQQQQTTGVY